MKHPDPGTFWFIVRCMSIGAAVLFVILTYVGMDKDVNEAVVTEAMDTCGKIVLLYLGFAQGIEAIGRYRDGKKSGSE